MISLLFFFLHVGHVSKSKLTQERQIKVVLGCKVKEGLNKAVSRNDLGLE